MISVPGILRVGILLLPAAQAAFAQGYLLSTIAGGGPPVTSIQATNAFIGRPDSVAADAAGNVYFAVAASNTVFKLDGAGVLSRVAGGGAAGSSGDGGLALKGQLNYPIALAVDSAGNLYIADKWNSRVRRISTSGIITTVAGTGDYGFFGDGGQAVSARLAYPQGVAVDAAGNLYISDLGNNRIRKVAANGVITTVAGKGGVGSSGDGEPATAATLDHPFHLAVDGSGNLYIADPEAERIRKVDSKGMITTAAGTGIYGYTGDGGPATLAQIRYPTDVATDTSGNWYIADASGIRRVGKTGIIGPYAGDYTGHSTFSGDGGPALGAGMGPAGLAIGPGGDLYIADRENERIRKISAAGTIATVAGGYIGDAGPAALAYLNLSRPSGVARDSAGNLFIADMFNHRVRRIDPNGIITTVAGMAASGYSGDGMKADSTRLFEPQSVAVDAAGNLYISEMQGLRIRKVAAAGGAISTIAGTGVYGTGGDTGPATSAQLAFPAGLAVDSSGNVYIAEMGAHRIRKVAANGTISTYAGTGVLGFSGDLGAASSARLASPQDVAVDAAGNLFIADTGNCRIRKVDKNGVITTVAGSATCGFFGDGAAATAARLSSPGGVGLDAAGNLYIADYGNYRIRLVSPAGVITTIAGNGAPSSSSDGAWATSAGMLAGSSIAVDSSGRVYLADFGTDSVRMLVPAGRAPSLTITLSHSAEFRVAQPAAAYTVKVTNTASAAPTSGTVTVTDILPDSLKLVSMSGSGWTCAANACTRADALAAGASYPAIGVLVSVDPAAPSQAVNRVYVSGGGAPTEGASDFTLIAPNAQLAAPVLVFPPNGMSNVAPIPTLTWNPSPGAYAYDVYLGAWGSTPPFAASTTATSYTPSTLYWGTAYYWKVVAKDIAGTQASATWSFWTQPPPQPPVVYSLTNSASYQESGINGFGIAQGSIFIVFGYKLGPETLQQAAGFPLPLQLGGTSISVSVGGKTVSAPVLYTSSSQVAAVLPSAVPVGDGTLLLSNGDLASSPQPIHVTRSAFGIFAVAQNGMGAAVITDPDYGLKTFDSPARQGDVLILWGTGLGPVDGDERAGPLPGNRFPDVAVYVGGAQAPIDYAGRSGCCAGLDQIVFRVPASPQGCFVPVAVRYGGITSNFATIPISAPGQGCREAIGVSSDLLTKAASGGELSVGVVAMGSIPLLHSVGFSFYRSFAEKLSRLLNVKVSEQDLKLVAKARGSARAAQLRAALAKYKPALQGKPGSTREVIRAVSALSDQGIAAGFSRLTGLGGLTSMFGAMLPPPGACTVVREWYFSKYQWGAAAQSRDAGPSLLLAGPLGNRTVPRTAAGEYQLPFGTDLSYAQFPTGVYDVSGSGGRDVGAFHASFQVSGLQWTNKPDIVSVDRTRPLRITWVGMPEPGYVLFGGVSSGYGTPAAFACVAAAGALELTVPDYVLSALPQTSGERGSLFLAAHPFQNTFSAPGLDIGYFSNLGSDSKDVVFR